MSEMFTIPPIEIGVYEHYKGNKYQVLGVGCHTETKEYFVVYRPLHEQAGLPDMWVRPYAMFIEDVAINGATIPRFKRVKD
jgi:hypothetical protein